MNFKTTLTKAGETFTHLGTAIYDGEGNFSIQLEGSESPFWFGETTQNNKIEEINFHLGYVFFGDLFNETTIGTFGSNKPGYMGRKIKGQMDYVKEFNEKFGNPKWETEVIS